MKERITQIQKSLPKGVEVDSYYDRTELSDRTIYTVARNLIEGAILVIIVLILLLENWRASLLVATIIPLSMLFAVILMRVFNVSGNLMSLGALRSGENVLRAVTKKLENDFKIALRFRSRSGVMSQTTCFVS